MTSDKLERVASAIAKARIGFGWTFGRRPKVMAIDQMMARAAIAACEAEAGERERVREAWDNGHAAGFREGHRAATAGEGEVG